MPPVPPAAGFGFGAEEVGVARRLAVLELACGVAGVNRVASVTLRGAGGTGIGRIWFGEGSRLPGGVGRREGG